jgi:hypothetical protein
VFWLVNLCSLFVYIEHNGNKPPKEHSTFPSLLKQNIHQYQNSVPKSQNCKIAFAKLQKVTVCFLVFVCLFTYLSVRPSVRLHGTTRIPPNGYSWNLTSEEFSKICRENSIFIKISEAWPSPYNKTCADLWYLPAEIFLEWEIFQAKVVKKIRTHTGCPKKIVHFLIFIS